MTTKQILRLLFLLTMITIPAAYVQYKNFYVDSVETNQQVRVLDKWESERHYKYTSYTNYYLKVEILSNGFVRTDSVESSTYNSTNIGNIITLPYNSKEIRDYGGLEKLIDALSFLWLVVVSVAALITLLVNLLSLAYKFILWE